MNQKGIIFNIQHFSISDGPGIRTTVFFKGCPLRCKWCHNPESWREQPEIGFNSEKCIGCGACVMACPTKAHSIRDGNHFYNRNACISCGKCVEVCPDALQWIGSQMTTKEVIEDIKRDASFYNKSGGGVTLSGGEPTEQFDFCLDILTECKKAGYHTAIETSGYFPKERLEELSRSVDLFLFDWKESNPEKHKSFTGRDNKLIYSNLINIDRMGKPIILRCPIIPEYNFTLEHQEGIIGIANELSNIQEVDIEPFHPLGKAKAQLIGINYQASNSYIPDENELQKFVNTIANRCSIPVIIS